MSPTPGPWQQHDADYCPLEIWGNLDGPLEDGAIRGTEICTVADGPEAEANARLIASAPDLLAALEGVLRVADRKTDEFDAARAAIAKAKGT